MEICKEMQQLRKLLDEKKIPWEDHSEDMTETEEFPMWICRTHFEYKDKRWSAINGFGTYGGWFGLNLGSKVSENMGLIELMELDEENPIGWLTAEDVIKEIEK